MSPWRCLRKNVIHRGSTQSPARWSSAIERRRFNRIVAKTRPIRRAHASQPRSPGPPRHVAFLFGAQRSWVAQRHQIRASCQRVSRQIASQTRCLHVIGQLFAGLAGAARLLQGFGPCSSAVPTSGTASATDAKKYAKSLSSSGVGARPRLPIRWAPELRNQQALHAALRARRPKAADTASAEFARGVARCLRPLVGVVHVAHSQTASTAARLHRSRPSQGVQRSSNDARIRAHQARSSPTSPTLVIRDKHVAINGCRRAVVCTSSRPALSSSSEWSLS